MGSKKLSKKSVISSRAQLNEQKFDLFLKNHEVKSLAQTLEWVTTLSRVERESWLKANGQFIDSALDDLLEDSSLLFDDLSISDEETLQLSKDLIFALKQTALMAEGILTDDELSA